MLSNAYFVAKFRFDTAENEPAKNLQNFRKMHFSKKRRREVWRGFRTAAKSWVPLAQEVAARKDASLASLLQKTFYMLRLSRARCWLGWVRCFISLHSPQDHAFNVYLLAIVFHFYFNRSPYLHRASLNELQCCAWFKTAQGDAMWSFLGGNAVGWTLGNLKNECASVPCLAWTLHVNSLFLYGIYGNSLTLQYT